MDDEGQMVQHLLDTVEIVWRILIAEYGTCAELAEAIARAAPRGSEEGRRARALRDRARLRKERTERMLHGMQQEIARENQKEKLRVIMGSLGEEEEW